MSLFDTVKDDDVIKEFKELDVANLTPIDALNTLYRTSEQTKEHRWRNDAANSGFRPITIDKICTQEK